MKVSRTQKISFNIGGMTCINCQTKIETMLLKLDGIFSAKVSWKEERAEVEFDEERISFKKICDEIERLGYTVNQGKNREERFITPLFYVLLIIILFMFLQKTGVMNLLVPSSLASSKMSYALLFVTGLLTSVHCVAMCGGINLSQSLVSARNEKRQVKKNTAKITNQPSRMKTFLPPLLYNLGRVASYTFIGFVLGTAGFFLGGSSSDGLSIPLDLQGILKILVGLIMLLTGISLLGIFPFLRKFTPHLPLFLSGKISVVQKKNAAPFIVGFLNGFMPCGPLQAMWIVALMASHPLSGAFSMFAFGLGTVPLMMGLGSIVSILGKKYTEAVMKAGAVLVIVMALSMLSQGFALGGWGSSGSGEKTPAVQKTEAAGRKSSDSSIEMKDGKQIIKSMLNPYRYPVITVKKGIPVHWEIEASENTLNGCNYKMIFRDFGFAYEMGYGTNVIEFTPEKVGNFQYTCWMGMVRGLVKVEE